MSIVAHRSDKKTNVCLEAMQHLKFTEYYVTL